ncbi:MAG: M50 family metallopeptidase [Chloroflexaceae bacterium]|nr:M50 family metallopeptidase [Chloroflexaceae bacterium]
MTMAHFVRGWRQREVLITLGLALVSVLLWRVAWAGWLFYPFHVFGTFVHELGHGFAAMATGGRFLQFVVRPDLSGTATTAGGVRWVVVSAGYLGSALFGGVLLIISAWGVSARRVLVGLGAALALVCLWYARNLFGFAAGLLMAAGLMVAGRRLDDRWASGLLLFLAVHSMLDALDSLFDLVKLSTHHRHVLTDAQTMAQYTMVPAVLWALLWCGLAIAMLVVSLNIAYRRVPTTVEERRTWSDTMRR